MGDRREWWLPEANGEWGSQVACGRGKWWAADATGGHWRQAVGTKAKCGIGKFVGSGCKWQQK